MQSSGLKKQEQALLNGLPWKETPKSRSSLPPVEVVVPLPRLRQDQWEIAISKAKVKTVAAGRRWGKTVLGAIVALSEAVEGKKIAWIAPTYKLSRPLWRLVESAATPLREYGAEINRSEHFVEFRRRGFIGIFSGDAVDCGVRGYDFDGVVIDEAAMLSETHWTDAIQPTLADRDGWVMAISTPRGRQNWFYREWARGREGNPRYKAWHAPSAANPSPQIRRAALEAIERVPERTYRQEWLAEFIENEGAVFRNIAACLTPGDVQTSHANHEVVIGVDWAQSVDFTAISVFCSTCRRELELDRFNQVDWALQRGRLAALANKWQASEILVERNSIGSPLLEALRDEDLPVIGFTTTAASKAKIIQSLALAFEREEAMWLDNPIGVAELEAFEAQASGITGRVTYSAPDGMHDDTVIARALAWRQAQVETWEVMQ